MTLVHGFGVLWRAGRRVCPPGGAMECHRPVLRRAERLFRPGFDARHRRHVADCGGLRGPLPALHRGRHRAPGPADCLPPAEPRCSRAVGDAHRRRLRQCAGWWCCLDRPERVNWGAPGNAYPVALQRWTTTSLTILAPTNTYQVEGTGKQPCHPAPPPWSAAPAGKARPRRSRSTPRPDRPSLPTPA